MSTAKGTILVTGANGGLGCAIVEQIASKPELAAYHGLYTVRDAKTAPALKEALARGASSHAHDILSLELTKLDSVRQVAAGVNVSEDPSTFPSSSQDSSISINPKRPGPRFLRRNPTHPRPDSQRRLHRIRTAIMDG